MTDPQPMKGGDMNTTFTPTGDELVDYTETCPVDGVSLAIDEEMISCPQCGWHAVFPEWLAAENGD